MDFLLLATTPQHAADDPAVERNAGRLKDWLAGRSIMDVMNTVAQLHAAIAPFNAQIMDESERLRLLEVYRHGLEEVFLIYDEQRLKVMPLSVEQRNVLANDVMGLYLELANGYKRVVRDAYARGENPAESATLLQAIYRAMELISLALLYAQRSGLAEPPLAWLELHQLYAFGERCDVLQRRVRAARHDAETPTIAQIYAQAMLMAVMHIDQLSGAELMDLFLLLEDYVSQCEFSHTLTDKAQSTCFVIDPMADAVPRKVSTLDNGNIAERLVMDVGPVRRAIERWLERHKLDEDGSVGQSAVQVRVLAGLLGSHWGRRAPRTVQHRFVKVALGLKALEYFLTDADRLRQACSAEVHGGIEVLSLDSEDDVKYQLSDWRMLDQSDMGCLLVGRVSAADERPAVGTLLGVVGFQPQVSQQRLSIGIVRWWGELSEGRTKLGIEVIEDAAQPILFGKTSECLSQTPELGFYFPKNDAQSRPASLLLPRRNNEEPFHVRVKGKAFEVETVSVVREAEYFMQYNFKVYIKGGIE